MVENRLSTFVTLALLWVCLLLPATTASVSSETLWTSLPDNAVTLDSQDTVATTEESAIRCAYLRLNRENCTSFCYDITTSTCYVSGLVTSLEVPVVSSGNLHCYGLCPSEPAGYRMYRGRCVKLVAEDRSYTVARDWCAAEGSHLYHLKSIDLDLPALFDLVTANGHNSSYFSVWVGADDFAEEGSFLWSDGSPLSLDSDVWKVGEPNDNNGNEDCVLYVRSLSGLNDQSCGYLKWFVCQIDL